MFFLTYEMLDRVEHFFFSLNRFYMALVAAPMVILMLARMGSMFPNCRLNRAVLALARTQVPIGDRQFLTSNSSLR